MSIGGPVPETGRALQELEPGRMVVSTRRRGLRGGAFGQSGPRGPRAIGRSSGPRKTLDMGQVDRVRARIQVAGSSLSARSSATERPSAELPSEIRCFEPLTATPSSGVQRPCRGRCLRDRAGEPRGDLLSVHGLG